MQSTQQVLNNYKLVECTREREPLCSELWTHRAKHRTGLLRGRELWGSWGARAAAPGQRCPAGTQMGGHPPLKKTILWSLVRSYTASTLSRRSGRPRQKRCTCAGCSDTRCRSRVSRQKYLPGGTQGVGLQVAGLGPRVGSAPLSASAGPRGGYL